MSESTFSKLIICEGAIDWRFNLTDIPFERYRIIHKKLHNLQPEENPDNLLESDYCMHYMKSGNFGIFQLLITSFMHEKAPSIVNLNCHQFLMLNYVPPEELAKVEEGKV